MAKILHGISTSDWHLDGGLKRLFPHDDTEKQLFEIEKIFKHAAKNGIGHIFNNGDISDKARIAEHTFIALVALLLKYDSVLSYWYILGNHDFAHVGKTAMDVLDVFVSNKVYKNVHLVKKPEQHILDGVHVCLTPFPFKESLRSKHPQLNFAHIEEVGALGDYGVPLKNAHLTLKRNPKDFTFSGHLHTYQNLKKQRLVYNGAPYQKTFGENLNKGFVEFMAKEVAGELKVKHTFIPSKPEFSLVDVLIEKSEDWAKLVKGTSQFYRITLGEGIITPKDIIKDIPNIMAIDGKRYRGGSSVDEDKILTFEEIPQFSELEELVKLLESEELSAKEIKYCVRMVQEAIEELNNQGNTLSL